MANAAYDKGIGSKERSVVSATKLWAIVLAFVVLLGVGMLLLFSASMNSGDRGGPASDNTSARPAEP